MVESIHRNRTVVTVVMSLVLTLILSCAPVLAYPDSPVTLVVPYGVGGGTDLVARMAARAMEKELGQPVVVLNRPGAGGGIGFTYVAQANPDGYTVLFVALPIVTLSVFEDYPLTHKDLLPIAQLNVDPAAIMARRDAPWKTVGDLVDYVRANPGRLRLGTVSPGAAWWIGAQMFKQEAGLQTLDIPYAEGASPILKAIAGGELQAGVTSAAEAAPLVQSGELRMLAVMADERLAGFPDVPTLKESGIDVSFGTWRGFMVPLGTPDDRVQVLSEAAASVVRDPEFVQFMDENLFGIQYRDADEFAEFMDSQFQYFQQLHATLGG